jgi:hypothetical protein
MSGSASHISLVAAMAVIAGAAAHAADDAPSACNLVTNASFGSLGEYGLPEGFRYDFQPDKSGVKPIVELSVTRDAPGGTNCLKVVSKNGKGVLRILFPVDLDNQPKSGHRYFRVKWRARTAGDARLHLEVDDRRELSSSMQSERWIGASAALEHDAPITSMCLVFEARNPGDTAWIKSPSVVRLVDDTPPPEVGKQAYYRCFVNNIWKIVPDSKIPELPAEVRESSTGNANIIANSSFELGPYAGKQLSQILRYKGVTDKGISTEDSYHGICSSRGHRFQTIYYKFKPNKLYTVSVFAKATKEGLNLKLAVRSGFKMYLGSKGNPDAPEVRKVFPLTTEWKRYHFSFVPSPDLDADKTKPLKPSRPEQKNLSLMMGTVFGFSSYQMNPKSAFKVLIDEQHDNGSIMVDSLQLEQGALTPYHTQTINACGIVLARSDTSDFCYYENVPIEATGRVFTEDETPRTLKLIYRMTDFFGHEVRRIERTCRTKGKRNLDDKFAFLTPGRGLHMLTMTVSDPDSGRDAVEVTGMQQAFCAVSPEPRRRPFDDKAMYGIHSNARRVHMEGYEVVWPNEYERMRKLGVKWFRAMGGARDTFSWAYVEPEEDKWRWDDNTLNHPAQDEFRILGSLYTVPTRFGGGSDIKSVNGHYDEWEEYVFQTVGRYRDRVKHWEVWNEPSWDSAVYSELMKRAARAARRADPEAKVIGFGGFTHANMLANMPGYKRHFETTLDTAGMESMDAVSIHGYYVARPEENWWPLSRRLSYLRTEMRKRGEVMPIWDSEMCETVEMFYTDRIDGTDNQWNRGDTGTGVEDPAVGLLGTTLPPRDAANWMAQTLAVYLAHGCEKFFYHFNMCAGGQLMDGNAGVLYEYDDSPKAHYAAWAASALMLDRSDFVTEVKLGNDIRCYVYEREGVPAATYWRVIGKKRVEPETLSFACSNAEIVFFDIMSNPLRGTRAKGNWWFGRKVVAPLNYDLCYIRGKGINTDRLVEILRGARRSGTEQQLRDYSAEMLAVMQEKEEKKGSGAEQTILDCPRAVNITIDGKMDDWQGRKPFTIDRFAQVAVGRPVAGVAASLQRGWKGKSDLSAKLWTAWDRDNVYWAALVTDDAVIESKHRGTPRAYEGDSVEVFLDVRERAKQATAKYDELVGQIGVTPATSAHPSATVTPSSKKNIVSGLTAASSPTKEGYFVEGKIPVRHLLPVGLRQDQVIGFDLAVDDTDDAANRKTQMIWVGTGDAPQDATLFGRLSLTGGGDAGAETRSHYINGGFEKIESFTKYEDQYKNWVKNGIDLPDTFIKPRGWHPQSHPDPKWILELIQDEKAAHSGKNCLKLPAGTVHYWDQPWSDVKVSDNDKITIKVWAKGPPGRKFDVRLFLYGYNEKGQSRSIYDDGAGGDGLLIGAAATAAWKQYVGTYVVPARNSVTLPNSRVRTVTPALTGKDVCFDDLQVEITRSAGDDR